MFSQVEYMSFGTSFMKLQESIAGETSKALSIYDLQSLDHSAKWSNPTQDLEQQAYNNTDDKRDMLRLQLESFS